MKKILFVAVSMIVFVLIFIFVRSYNPNTNTKIDIDKNSKTDVAVTQDNTITSKILKVIEPVLYPTQSRTPGMFESIVLKTEQPIFELSEIVGDSNVPIVLGINRIDSDNLDSGMTIIIPKNTDDIEQWQFMPNKLSSAKSIPKLIIVSQPIQAFGAYEYGELVLSGPVSTGKKSKQTPSGLFFVNWKGEEVVSTFDDEWILFWNMNIDNFAGISLHQYSLPGFPASHSCVRLVESDANWLYNWVEDWSLRGDKVTTEGTPVIIYGEYNFEGPPPWTLLPENPKSTDTPRLILEKVINRYKSEIVLGTRISE